MNQVNELMHGANLIQLYHQEKQFFQNLINCSKNEQTDKQIVWVSALSSWPLTEFLKYSAVILTIVGQQILDGTMSLPLVYCLSISIILSDYLR